MSDSTAPTMPVDDVVDPHIHLFDLLGTPRPMQPIGKLFRGNEKLVRAAAIKAMPASTIAYFGTRTDLFGDYLPTQFRADSASSKVGRYVHIEAGWSNKTPMDPVGETVWLDALPDGPAAIVGHADLTRGTAAGAVMRGHLDASHKVRGIRHSMSWHEAGGVMDFGTAKAMSRMSGYRAGFDQLAVHGLSFDAWCFAEQIPHVTELADHNPDVPIVLCHLGTPVGIGGEFAGIGATPAERDRISGRWRDALADLASRPQVSAKISGLLMPALGFGHEHTEASPSVDRLAEELGPMVEHALAVFGPDRCMFASNFPVDRVSSDYETVTRAMLQLTESLDDAAQAALWRDTAVRFYRLT